MTASSPVPGADGLRHGALPASGLPARILAVLRAGGCATLGDLRPPLPAGAKLDADDRALLARIAAYAAAAIDGHPPPLDVSEWLALFLPPRLADDPFAGERAFMSRFPTQQMGKTLHRQ